MTLDGHRKPTKIVGAAVVTKMDADANLAKNVIVDIIGLDRQEALTRRARNVKILRVVMWMKHAQQIPTLSVVSARAAVTCSNRQQTTLPTPVLNALRSRTAFLTELLAVGPKTRSALRATLNSSCLLISRRVRRASTAAPNAQGARSP